MEAQKLSNRLAFFGLLFLVVTFLFCWVIFPKVVTWQIEKQTQFINGSDTYEKWRNITMPIFIQFTFFNVTNPAGIVKGEKPIFEQVGPFVYKEGRFKDIQEINNDDNTLKYRQAITYYFRPEESFGNSEDVELNVLNVPLASVAKLIINSGSSMQGMVLRDSVNEFIRENDEPLFLKRTVRQMLFEGYHVPLFEELAKLKGEEIVPNNTFGLYFPKNGTYSTEYIVGSGSTNKAEFGMIKKWDNDTQLIWWNDTKCNEILGTDGSVFAPFVNRDRILKIFSEEFCRSIFMTYEKDVEYEGIPAYRFKMSPSIWENGLSNLENKCFCTNGGVITGDDKIQKACSKNGVMSLAGCKKGAPIFASPAFFLYGDESDQSILGVTPNTEEHDTYLDLEPNTGMVVRASKKFQVNVEINPDKRLIGFKKIPQMLFPIIWGEERVSIPEDRVDIIKNKLVLPKTLVEVLKWYFVAGSFLIVCIALGIRMAKKITGGPKSYAL